MVNAGFNPLQAISKKTGKSMEQLKKEMAKGEVSFKDVAEAMQEATKDGGKFYKMMEKQSQTMEGRISTLKDAFNRAMGEGVKPFYDLIRDDLLPMVITFANNGSSAMKTFSQNSIMALKGTYNATSEVRKNFKQLITDIKTGSESGGLLITVLKEHFEDWRWKTVHAFNDIIGAVGDLLVALAEIGRVAWNSFGAVVNAVQMGSDALDGVASVITWNTENADNALESLKGNWQDFKNNITGGMAGLSKSVDSIWNAPKRILTSQSYDNMKAERDEQSKWSSMQNYYEKRYGKTKDDVFGTTELTWTTLNGLDDFESKVGDKLKSVGETLSEVANKYWNFNDIFGVTQIKKLSFKDLRYRMEQRLKIFEQFQSALKTIGEKFGKGSMIYGEILQRGVSATGEALALAQMPSDIAGQYSERFGRTVGMGVGFAQEQMAFNKQQEVISQEININIPPQNDPQAIVNEVVRRLKVVGAM